MTLKEVMTVLDSNNTGLNRKHLYLMLFEHDKQDTSDQKVKNIFYNRPLDTVIYVRLCSDDGFLLLSQRIHEQYFRTSGNYRLIYNC